MVIQHNVNMMISSFLYDDDATNQSTLNSTLSAVGNGIGYDVTNAVNLVGGGIFGS